MNTLFRILEEIINFIPLGNVVDCLVVNEKSFYNFSFIRFNEDNFLKNYTCKDLNYLINILLYFDFVKDNKKLISSNLDLIQCCSSITFFNRSISYFVKLIPEFGIFSAKNLNAPIKKLFHGILICKKSEELKKMVGFWKNYHLKIILIGILNQSFQENIKKKLYDTARSEFKNDLGVADSKHLYLLKKRLECISFKLLERKFYLNKKILLNSDSSKSNFYSNFISELDHLLTKKNLKSCVNFINFCLCFRRSSLIIGIHNSSKFFREYLIKLKKEYLLNKANSNKIILINKNKAEHYFETCNCFMGDNYLLKKLRYIQENESIKFRIHDKDDPLISLF